MRILFVTSKNPEVYDEADGFFVREYVRELRKYADVICVYLRTEKGPCPEVKNTVDYVFSPKSAFEAFSPEAIFLETAASFRSSMENLVSTFKPDIIHCADSNSYLPFRFDENVFYSAQFFQGPENPSVPDAPFLVETKIERCALKTASAVAVYSDFSAEKAEKLSGGTCVPIVLPLGIRAENFIKTTEQSPFLRRSGGELMVAEKTPPLEKKMRISCFARMENPENGVSDFVFAVNTLGKAFKEKYNIEYSLYGNGKTIAGLDLSLFDNRTFLNGENKFSAYRKSDIVVIPSRHEPFGFAGLEAMATGALVLLPKGLGMDMYAEPGFNCLEIPHESVRMAEVIKDAVSCFSGYKLLRDNATRTALRWTWRRCVKAHMYVYRQVVQGRLSQLCSAYRKEEREVIENYRNASDVEKLYAAETERKALFRLLRNESSKMTAFQGEVDPDSFLELLKNLERQGRKILALTGSYLPDKGTFGRNVETFSVLNEGESGITVRPECLPFKDGEFDTVIVCGAWESVIEPCGALVEFQRVSKKNVIVLYNKGFPYPWQTFQIEDESDWKKLTGEGWVLVDDENQADCKNVHYGEVSFAKRKTAETGSEIIA